jgi:hypothetical protein
VYGLFRDSQNGGDLLPRPIMSASVADLQLLEFVHQPAERSDRAQPNGRISAAGISGNLRSASHVVNLH